MLISPKDNNFYNFRRELILTLKDLYSDVVLVCPYGQKIDYFTDRGCRFIDTSIDRRGKSIVKDLHLLKQYYTILKNERPDLVLTFTTKPSVYAGYACGKLRTPFIVNNAGIMEASGLFSWFMNLLYKLGFHKASYIMCQNEYEKEYLSKLLNSNMKYIRIPGSGVNTSYFCYKDYPQDSSSIVFNYVALIKRIKGISEFLECAKRIKKKYPNTHFRIFGEYDSTDYTEEIRKLCDQGIIEYKGVVLDMRPEIEACHAVIHPSYYEGMTNVVLEHSSMGRPAIGSDIPGVREGIEDKKTGFLFEAKNVDSLEDAVEAFISLSNDDRRKMGKAARIKMEKEFDRGIVTSTYLETIKQVLEQKEK